MMIIIMVMITMYLDNTSAERLDDLPQLALVLHVKNLRAHMTNSK